MFDHLVTEDLVAVEDFDGNAVTSVDVSGELDLGKGTLTQGFTQLVVPDTCPRRLFLLQAHLLPRCPIKNQQKTECPVVVKGEAPAGCSCRTQCQSCSKMCAFLNMIEG